MSIFRKKLLSLAVVATMVLSTPLGVFAQEITSDTKAEIASEIVVPDILVDTVTPAEEPIVPLEIPINIKQELTVPDEIKVELDQVPVEFSSSYPVFRYDTIYVPFIDVLGASGFKSTFETSTKTVTSVNGEGTLKLIVSAGNKTVHVTKGEVTSDVQLINPPLIINNQTYVSADSFYALLGYNVGWDDAEGTVVLIDLDKLLAEYKDQFTIMDKYMAYSKKFSEGSYKAAGKFDMSMTMGAGAGAGAIPVKVLGTVDGMTSKSKTQLNMNFDIDMDQVFAQLDETSKPTQKDLDMLKDIKVNVYMDTDEGLIYMNSPLFNTLDPTIKEDTWLEIDFNELLQQANMGSITFSDLMQISTGDSYLQLMKDILGMMPINSTESPEQIKGAMKIYANVFGDKSFVKDGSKYVSTYKEKAFDGSTVTSVITLNTNSKDEVISYSISVSNTSQGVELMNISVSQDVNNRNKINMKVSIPELMEIIYNFDITYTKSNVYPTMKPSSDSTIISFEDLLY